MKIGLVNPYSVGLQTLAMDEDTTNSTSDDSGIMLLETTYNTLRSTATEEKGYGVFLGKSKIDRWYIENITFETSIPNTVYDSTTRTFIDSTAWDVSEAGDNSIIAWYEKSNDKGILKVHIGSNGTIYANKNSKYLFNLL